MLIGELTEQQLRFLVDQLEEGEPRRGRVWWRGGANGRSSAPEGSGDQDYYLDWATLDLLQEAGADAELLDLLRRCLERRAAATAHPFRDAAAAEAPEVESVDIVWESDEDVSLP